MQMKMFFLRPNKKPSSENKKGDCDSKSDDETYRSDDYEWVWMIGVAQTVSI